MSQYSLYFNILPLKHESIIFIACCIITFCLFEELSTFRYYYMARKKNKLASSTETNPAVLPPPNLGNNDDKFDCSLDLLGSLKYMPNNGKINDKNSSGEDTTDQLTASSSSPIASPPSSPFPSSSSNSSFSSPQPSTPSTTRLISNVQSPLNDSSSTENEFEIHQQISRLTHPIPPGCEYKGEGYLYLKKNFPQLGSVDIIRFLIARKGSVKKAEEMIEKYLAWRSLHFPIKRKVVANAFKSKCFFPYGKSKDGSPIVIMRGCLYDSTLATPEEYVLAASYCIEYALANHKGQPSVTVLVHTAQVEDGPNEAADLQFIKLFIQVLSDNFPERLRRLAIYPFPFYGRMIWKVLKVFLDKRTQDKIMLLNPGKHDKTGFPSDLQEYIDLSEIPTYIGGTSTAPAVELIETIEE